MLKNITFQYENSKTGNLVSNKIVKELSINNTSSFPVTFGVVDEFKKQVGKMVLKALKENNMHCMLTLYGYDYDYYTKNLVRFTFSGYNGKMHVEYRPYNSNKGFEVACEKEFNNNSQAKKYIMNMIESYVFENINVKENKENYFTSDGEE